MKLKKGRLLIDQHNKNYLYGGKFGGNYVPETLKKPIEDLTNLFGKLRRDKKFLNDRDLLGNYINNSSILSAIKASNPQIIGVIQNIVREEAEKVKEKEDYTEISKVFDQWVLGTNSKRRKNEINESSKNCLCVLFPFKNFFRSLSFTAVMIVSVVVTIGLEC